MVGIATGHDGFVYGPDGLDLAAARTAAEAGRPLAELPGVRHWPDARAGLAATEADLLVEVSASPPEDGQPGWPTCARRCAAGYRRSRRTSGRSPWTGWRWPRWPATRAVPFRAESTVMSGTPVLSTLTEGLAGARPLGLRGLLNATVNDILTRMAGGLSYSDALAAAQDAGLAEPDPAADVSGLDEVAKVMILSALVFGRPLTRADVSYRGIDDLPGQALDEARAAGGTLKHVASLSFAEPGRRRRGQRPGPDRGRPPR